MKYIIELKDDVQVVQKVGVTENGNAFVMNFYKDQLEELNSDYINEHFGDLQDTAYKKGFEDGKAVNDKGCEWCQYQTRTVFDEPCVRCSNAYKSQWKAKSDKIVVGDEVEWTGDKYIVTYINYDIDTSEITDYDLLGDDGSVADHVKKCAFTKTGRHFDIQSILEEMQHD